MLPQNALSQCTSLKDVESGIIDQKSGRSVVAAFAPPSGSVSARVQLKNALLFGELQQQE